MKRRDFIKTTFGGMAAVVVGSQVPWIGTAYGQVAAQRLRVTITDAIKEMVTHNAINSAECYFWIYKMELLDANGAVVDDIPAECPGPIIMTSPGEPVELEVTNNLPEPHAFYIPGIIDSGEIAPNGGTWTGTIPGTSAGAHLYYDNLNEPVNRMMGLHGAFIVRSNSSYPYEVPTPGVKTIYDSFGSTPYFPGLPWHVGDSDIPARRTYIWLTHEASPKLFAEVGDWNYAANGPYPADQFVELFLRDPFQPHAFHSDNPGGNRIPQYFTLNGQSGHFAHNNAYATPMGRVGEPVIVHILNAGLWTHSMHLHANHFYVTSVNGVVSENPIWVDVYNVHPMDRVDYTVPFMRPPDIPNVRGIGYPDTPLVSPVTGKPVWPPVEEFEQHFPPIGTMATDRFGNPVDLAQSQSPLCYPMHDHSEPSQTAQGGNYNCGLISGIYFVGDRNTPGFMDFPMDEEFAMMYKPGGIPARGCTKTEEACPAPMPPMA